MIHGLQRLALEGNQSISNRLLFPSCPHQCQLIVCQMSSTRCQPLNWMLLPLALVIFVVVSGVAPHWENLLLYLLTALITLAHIHYGVGVVSLPLGLGFHCSGSACRIYFVPLLFSFAGGVAFKPWNTRWNTSDPKAFARQIEAFI